ncbi:hypothetical protein DFJ77DRAFT_29239 [Powellomyces hirtus]|nr:hypothetical protein DFJ77DRAFT_29239 [Powellomyces hirtus]
MMGRVPGSDGEIRPKLSPIATIARRYQLQHAQSSKNYILFHDSEDAGMTANIYVDGKPHLLHSWDEIIQHYVRHTYSGASDHEIREGLAIDCPDPFPFVACCKVVPVGLDDPRVKLRGRKKVVTDRFIRKNEVIGIYEGEVLFEEEQVSVGLGMGSSVRGERAGGMMAGWLFMGLIQARLGLCSSSSEDSFICFKCWDVKR